MTCGDMPNYLSLCWNDVIGSSSSSNVTDLASPRLMLPIDVTFFFTLVVNSLGNFFGGISFSGIGFLVELDV